MRQLSTTGSLPRACQALRMAASGTMRRLHGAGRAIQKARLALSSIL